MLLLDDVRYLWRQRPHDIPSWLPAYASYAHQLNYQPVVFIEEVQSVLKNNIITYARQHSTICKKLYNRVITKDNLRNKKSWYTPTSGNDTKTSGSTNGRAFTYRYWPTIYRTIENDGHYALINQEFGIDNATPQVAYLMLDDED